MEVALLKLSALGFATDYRDFTLTLHFPIRSTFTITVALLITALIASASVCASTLGNIVSQSALGLPLRIVIALAAAPGELLGASCFKIVPTSANGNGRPQLLTAKVSVERDATEPRLIVTTAHVIEDPIVRLTLQAGREGSNQRDYVLLFDQPANTHAAAAPAVMLAAAQPSPAPRDAQSRASRSPAPNVVATVAPAASIAEVDNIGYGRIAPRATEPATGFRRPSAPVEASPKTTPLKAAAEPITEIGGSQSWLYFAAALGGTGIVVLIVLAIRLWREYEEPAWIGSSSASPSSITQVGAKPVTLPNLPAVSGFPVPAGSGRPSEFKPEPETTLVDSLLGEIDDDLIEERAVREAWAAARREVENDSASNSILRAIEAAERDMQLSIPPRTQAETTRGLTIASQARTNFPLSLNGTEEKGEGNGGATG